MYLLSFVKGCIISVFEVLVSILIVNINTGTQLHPTDKFQIEQNIHCEFTISLNKKMFILLTNHINNLFTLIDNKCDLLLITVVKTG